MRSWCLDPKQGLIWKLGLFSLFFADLLLSKCAARSEEERTSFQVNIFTYLQRCGDIQLSVGRPGRGQAGQLGLGCALINPSLTDETLDV